jgi:Domain of unknown function (DUF4333)
VRRRSALVLVALVLAGCGASEDGKVIDRAGAEGFARKVAGSGPIKLKSLECPDGQEAKAGESFDCDIEYADGAKGTITLHMTNDSGGLRTSAAEIHVSR